MECPFETPVEAKKSSTDPDLRYIASKDKNKVGYVCGDINKEYADYIVQAINCHEKLIEACEKALELISEDLEYAGEPVRENNYKFLEQALKEAEKQ